MILGMRQPSEELMENQHLKGAKAMDFVTSPHLRRQVGTIFLLQNTKEEFCLSLKFKGEVC